MNNNIMEVLFFAGGDVKSQNRGCQALGFGGIEFIYEKYGNDFTLLLPIFTRKRKKDYKIEASDGKKRNIFCKSYIYTDIIFAYIELKILKKKKENLKNKLANDLIDSKYFLNINGGDSFSDIYGLKQFMIFLLPSIVAILFNKKLCLLPQTIGPFNKNYAIRISKYILRKAQKVFIRDDEFEHKLIKWGIIYEKKKDVSSYMLPTPVKKYENISNAIGFNISGLTYFNNYGGLKGHYDNYGKLANEIIVDFQKKNIPVWLIPHTYNVLNPSSSDDLSAIKEVYNNLESKKNVFIIEDDLNGMELKFIISKFSYFIGTRMHSCFAGIYSNIPTFGLAYSYKFKGTFDKMNMRENYYDINNLKEIEISNLIKILNKKYDFAIKL